jgi:perosamine synthetase
MTNKKYIHDNLAYNYRMTNIQAALLYGQLLDFKNIIMKKKEIYENYKILFSELIKDKIITLPVKNENCVNANWMFIIKLNNKKYIDTRPFFIQ